MQKQIEHKIVLSLNSTGWRGEEIDALLPEFIAERDTLVGLTWTSSYYGPESFNLVITVAASVVTVIASNFLSELSKDLYQWMKSKLLAALEKKQHPEGDIEIQIGKSSIYTHVDEILLLEDLFTHLPELISQTNEQPGVNNWKLEYDNTTREWLVIQESE